MAKKTYVGTQNGDYLTASNWSTGTAPAPYDMLIDNFYNINISNATINREIIDLYQTGFNNSTGTIAGLSLNNSTLGRETLVLSQRTVGFGQITLDDSYLRGALLNVEGQTQVSIDTGHYAVNFGIMASIGTATIQSGLGVIANGSFENDGVMESSGPNGSLYVVGAFSQFQNNGLIEAGPGGYVGIIEPVINYGQINANGGSLGGYANILQGRHGSISLTNNSTMTLNAACDGGTININASTLNFAPAEFLPGQTAANDFVSYINFTGQTGTLGFGVDIAAEFRQ